MAMDLPAWPPVEIDAPSGLADALGLALAVFFPGAVLLSVLFSALQGIYVAALYQYATGGSGTPAMDRDLLAVFRLDGRQRECQHLEPLKKMRPALQKRVASGTSLSYDLYGTFGAQFE